MADLKNENATTTKPHFLPKKWRFLILFAVADGLGGHMTGETAYATALKILRDELETGITDSKTSLEKISHFIFSKNQQQSEINRKYFGMTTTLITGLINNDGWMWVMNVRDICAYLIGGTVQHTRDQSIFENLIEMGEITRE